MLSPRGANAALPRLFRRNYPLPSSREPSGKHDVEAGCRHAEPLHLFTHRQFVWLSFVISSSPQSAGDSFGDTGTFFSPSSFWCRFPKVGTNRRGRVCVLCPFCETVCVIINSSVALVSRQRRPALVTFLKVDVEVGGGVGYGRPQCRSLENNPSLRVLMNEITQT